MRIHAIQTGTVRVKTAQVQGRRHGLIDVFLDPNWTDWVPTYAWAIEHPDGVIIVDSGQGTHLLEALMLSGTVDGVSADHKVAKATLAAIKRFTQSRPTIYLPTHDPESGTRLAQRQYA